MHLILQPAQAQAIAATMRALNPIEGRVNVTFAGLQVTERENGIVVILDGNKLRTEVHASQQGFALAYGLPKTKLQARETPAAIAKECEQRFQDGGPRVFIATPAGDSNSWGSGDLRGSGNSAKRTAEYADPHELVYARRHRRGSAYGWVEIRRPA